MLAFNHPAHYTTVNAPYELVEQVPITPNERHSYRFYFSGTANEPVEFIANFKGSGQSTNVNSLLTYNAPVESQTRIPAGTDSYATSVFYGRNIIPQSFHAEFNGTDISSLFHPIPGTNERVKLPPLVSGRNLLHLTINGNINNKVSTDSDRLVFVVP